MSLDLGLLFGVSLGRFSLESCSSTDGNFAAGIALPLGDVCLWLGESSELEGKRELVDNNFLSSAPQASLE